MACFMSILVYTKGRLFYAQNPESIFGGGHTDSPSELAQRPEEHPNILSQQLGFLGR